jgi:uncharacterized protein YhbP (UPF0306 family)
VKIDDELLPELLALSTMTLATTGPSAAPYAAPVYFAADPELRLLFFSAADSQHGRNLAKDPRAAVARYPECRDWREIRGAQARGRVSRLEAGPERGAALAVYLEKYPFVEAMQDELARNHLYAFTPEWLRLVDNRRGFGFKREWDLA